ncbi:hypothetical protein [Kitasatospora kifunensis]|uniref:Uncharacterized protein n=1 Tax=Kitasatospora kifunensis TaxID=58351 RepID=A0A7W7QYW0_KITKI|nr:hypothetical protein [Kitasatospora kifunensis]MBB4922269.1 hypothetical protein [Kitasatospora kifunensis]
MPIPPPRAGVPMPNFTATQELFRADGLTLNGNSDTVTANVKNQVNNATGGLIDVSSVANGLLVVNVANAPSGSSPGLAVFFDVQDAYGNWCLTSNPTAISGAVLNFAAVVYGQISTGYNLTYAGRIRWVVTGTGGPMFSGVSFSLFGR